MRSTCASRDRHSCGRTSERHGPARPFAAAWCVAVCLALPGCSGCDDPRAEEKPPATASQRPSEVETAAADAEDRAASDGEPAGGEPSASEAASARGGSSDEGAMARDGREATGERGGATNSSGKPAKASTAAEALRQAATLRTQSQQAARGGDPGEAFLKASRAWQLVSQFPESAACAAMSAELLAELEALGEQSNQRFGTEPASVPLINR